MFICMNTKSQVVSAFLPKQPGPNSAGSATDEGWRGLSDEDCESDCESDSKMGGAREKADGKQD